MHRIVPAAVSTLAVLVATAWAAAGASPSPGIAEAVPTASAGPNGVGPAGSASPVPMTPAGLLLWPAPPNPMELTVAAGLTPERSESLAYHVHSGLLIFKDGEPVAVPAGIGIDISNPGVMSFPDPLGTEYGGIEGCDVPCISPLHTHWWAGVLHTESATPVPNRLGQFFVEWAVRLEAACVGEFCTPETPIAIHVDGAPFTGDPATIELTDRRLITIVIGTPPAVMPTSFDFELP
jgi:hypothetical protein